MYVRRYNYAFIIQVTAQAHVHTATTAAASATAEEEERNTFGISQQNIFIRRLYLYAFRMACCLDRLMFQAKE